MAILNIEDMILYGMSWTWANEVFSGASPTNKENNAAWLNTNLGVYTTPSNYPIDGPYWADSLVSSPYVRNSNITLGSNEFQLFGTQIQSGLKKSRNLPAAKIFNYIIHNNDQSNPFELRYPAIGVIRDENPKEDKVSAVKDFELYIDQSNIQYDEITIKPKDDDVSSTEGVISAQKSSVDSLVLPFSFQFVPGSTESHTFTYSTSQTASYTTTNGTTSSTSTSGETSFDVTNSITAEAGIKAGPVEATSGVSNSVSNGWSNAWSSMKEVNFSESSATSSTDELSYSVTIDPGSITKNKDGNYIYTHKVVQPDGTVITNTAGFIPAAYYTAHVTKSLTTINNNFSGVYEIGGGVGTLSDSEKVHIIAPSTSQALTAANNSNYSVIANIDGFDFENSNILGIDFSGSALGSANITTGWNVTFTENAAQSNDSSPNNSSAFKSLHNQSADLTTYDSSKLDGLGVSYTFHEDSTGTKSVTGSGYTDVVYASTLGTHAFSNFKESFLHGNDNADTFSLNKRNSGNSIDTFGGNDTLKVSSSQVVDLGSGDDKYIIRKNSTKSSQHQIHTGDGEDTLIINSLKSAFTITDFNPFLDQIKVGRGLDNDLLAAKLVPFEKKNKILDNAKINFFYDNDLIGTAYMINNDADFIEDLFDPLTHRSISKLNHKSYSQNRIRRTDSPFKAFEKSVNSGMAYSAPIVPERLKTPIFEYESDTLISQTTQAITEII